MTALIKTCLFLLTLHVSQSEEVSYSFSSTKASYLQFSPQSWLPAAGGVSPLQLMSFRFKTHTSDGLLVFINDGAVAVRLADGHIDVSTASADSAAFRDNYRTSQLYFSAIYPLYFFFDQLHILKVIIF